MLMAPQPPPSRHAQKGCGTAAIARTDRRSSHLVDRARGTESRDTTADANDDCVTTARGCSAEVGTFGIDLAPALVASGL